MPIRRPKPSARIGRASGRRSRARPARRSSARWKSGWPSSKIASSSRARRTSCRADGDGHAAWPGSSPRPRRPALNAPAPRARVHNRPTTSVAGGADAAAVAVRHPPLSPASRHHRSRDRPSRGRPVPNDRRDSPDLKASNEAAIGAPEEATPRPDRPRQGERETRQAFPPRRRANFPDGGAAVGVEAAARGLAVRRIPAVLQILAVARVATRAQAD